MMTIDMWYGNKIQEINGIIINFSDCDCVYRGNVYIDEKIVGDFTTPDSIEIEETFAQFDFNKIWNC